MRYGISGAMVLARFSSVKPLHGICYFYNPLSPTGGALTDEPRLDKDKYLYSPILSLLEGQNLVVLAKAAASLQKPHIDDRIKPEIVGVNDAEFVKFASSRLYETMPGCVLGIDVDSENEGFLKPHGRGRSSGEWSPAVRLRIFGFLRIAG